MVEAVLRLIGERAPFARPRHTQLLQARDGWIAVSLARADDIASVPAWLGTDDLAAVADRTTAELVAQATLLGMPVAALGEYGGPAIVRHAYERIAPTCRTEATRSTRLGVIDLSSLWAGPLCTRLLAEAGAYVVKVESTTRPDGGRIGSPEFFERLNSRKSHVALDLSSAAGVAQLRDLINNADVVVESTRPRALRQLGIDAADFLQADDGLRVWASITGYGRSSNRVAFGDDAAVAGGLVRPGPCFTDDAIADPLTGLRAAAAIFEALTSDDPCLLDIAMAGVAREVAGTAPSNLASWNRSAGTTAPSSDAP
ncbi:MAG: hypothetical protein QOJ00_1655 [Actinomycetota bacterium]